MSTSIIVTFIRHGESTDNLKSVWSGWNDVPLTNHGMNQARALGKYFADIHFTAIHTSVSTRALTTAQALYDAQREPKPTFDSSELIREQHFGIVEGKPSSYDPDPNINLKEEVDKGVYPVPHGNDGKFPEGESTNELAQRAKEAIATLVLPHVWQTANEGKTGIHVAVVSHGLTISQMISELLKMSAKHDEERDCRGLWNTAWTRVVIDIEGAQEGQPMAVDKERPLLVMHVTDVNRHSHTDNIRREEGGIGSAAYDPKQKDIMAFFGGKPESQPGSDINAHDSRE